MKLRSRFTIISSVTFGIVFIIASVIIYLSFYGYSERMIFKELQKTCVLSGIYYLEKDELPTEKHSEIREQFLELQNIVVRLYDLNDNISFGKKGSDHNIDTEVLEYVRKNREFGFKSENHFYYGIFYHDNQGDFVVFVKSNDKDFKAQTNQLLIIMIIVLLAGLVLIYILSRLLSDIAYRPVKDIIDQVNHIEANSLEKPIVLPNAKDEIYELVETYNSLLKRLSDTFIIQKNFINYVSHEFKTPLASIAGNLEVLAQKDRTAEEYRQMSGKVLDNVYEIESIMNTLMMLSGLRTTPGTFETYRVDEVIWDINDQLAEVYSVNAPKLQIVVEVSNDKLFEAKGNCAEIKIALYNIIENAIKYSDGNPVQIKLVEVNNKLQLIVQDEGRGITEEDMKFIKQTFYRGKNTDAVSGNGIGLSLAIIIFRQNKIDFNISSQEGVGTTVTLLF